MHPQSRVLFATCYYVFSYDNGLFASLKQLLNDDGTQLCSGPIQAVTLAGVSLQHSERYLYHQSFRRSNSLQRNWRLKFDQLSCLLEEHLLLWHALLSITNSTLAIRFLSGSVELMQKRNWFPNHGKAVTHAMIGGIECFMTCESTIPEAVQGTGKRRMLLALHYAFCEICSSEKKVKEAAAETLAVEAKAEQDKIGEKDTDGWHIPLTEDVLEEGTLGAATRSDHTRQYLCIIPAFPLMTLNIFFSLITALEWPRGSPEEALTYWRLREKD